MLTVERMASTDVASPGMATDVSAQSLSPTHAGIWRWTDHDQSTESKSSIVAGIHLANRILAAIPVYGSTEELITANSAVGSLGKSLLDAETDDEDSLPPGYSHPRLSGLKTGDDLYSAARSSIRSFHCDSLHLPLPAAPQSIQDVMDAHLGQQSVSMVGFGSTPTLSLHTTVGHSSPAPVKQPPKSPPTPIPAKKTSPYDFPQYALDSFTPDADAAIPETMAELVGAFLPIAPQADQPCSTIAAAGAPSNRSSPYPWMSRERSTGSISAATGGEEHVEDALELFSMEII